MSFSGEAFLDLLSEKSSLKKENNPARKVIMNTIGEWLDNHNISDLFDNVFINTANGGYLDLFGKDFDIPRQAGETDDNYRQRIVFEKLEWLTVHNLQNIYGVEIYNAFDGFNPQNNTLTSDNPYLSDFYFGIVDEDVQKILDGKFVLDVKFLWFDGNELDYIFNTDNNGILESYINIYQKNNLSFYFNNNKSIQNVKLTLENANNCEYMFYGCSNLKSVTLNLPNAYGLTGFLPNNFKIEYINLTIPNNLVSRVVDEVLQIHNQAYNKLNTFIINGFEVDLN